MKSIQIKYRLIYFFRNRIYGAPKLKIYNDHIQGNILNLQESVVQRKSYGQGTFQFLNQRKNFKNINWDFKEFGLLWTFNLNYFDYLHQQDMDRDQAIKLIEDFISKQEVMQTAFMSYPISLRGINWIKAFKKYEISDLSFDRSLRAQYGILEKNIEYQHMANHLIENGFSLLFGAYYYNDQRLYKKAKKILIKELEEQILDDGAHFELSPMYHQTILYRVLDSYNLVKNNDQFDHELEDLLYQKAVIMLSWLDQMTFEDGTIPNFNDSSNYIAPTTQDLKAYAERLNITYKIQKLWNSGYRKFVGSTHEIIIDVGNLGAVDYNLAHSHNDMLSYEIHAGNIPFIVNAGTSTYENNARRIHERQTSAHNTVMVDGKEQNHVWSVHRVAERTKCIIEKDETNAVKARVNGVFDRRLSHSRSFENGVGKIVVNDKVTGIHEAAVSYIHFAPDIHPELFDNDLSDKVVKCKIADKLLAQIEFENLKSIKIEDYKYAMGYNKLVPAKMLVVKFSDQLKTQIIF